MDSDINHIGQRIRRLRRESKMTLLEVATASSLSVGFLSQVERNLTGISISSLVNVAKALSVPLGALLEHPRQAQPDSHEGRRESYRVGPMRQRYERLSTTFDGSMLNAVKVLMLEGYTSEWVAHGGDEFVYVLSGQVRYTLRKKDYVLAAGDSLHFNAQERHRVVNDGPGPAELIVVGTLPLFDDDRSEYEPLTKTSKARATAAKRDKAASPSPEKAKPRAARAAMKDKSAIAKETAKPARAATPEKSVRRSPKTR